MAETEHDGGSSEQEAERRQSGRAGAASGRASTPAASGTPGTIVDGATADLEARPGPPPSEREPIMRPEGGMGSEPTADPEDAGQTGH